MKPFDLEKAKAGKPVVTRDGRPARIICWDRKKTDYSIVALIGDNEEISSFTTNGSYSHCGEDPKDLFMATEKKEGWVNIYSNSIVDRRHIGCIYPSKEKAFAGRYIDGYIATTKVEWEE